MTGWLILNLVVHNLAISWLGSLQNYRDYRVNRTIMDAEEKEEAPQFNTLYTSERQEEDSE